MIPGFAFECYADAQVARFLREQCSLKFKPIHTHSQGEVINALLKAGRARVGMVDEDPKSTHHRLRDTMKVVTATQYVEVRQLADKRLIIIRPDLETCFLKSMEVHGLNCTVATEVRELHRALGKETTRRHEQFYEDLKNLSASSTSIQQSSFLTELEEAARAGGL